MKLGDWLTQNNVSLSEFGRRINVNSPSTVRRYAQGERVPKPSIMPRIVKETNGEVTPNDFLTIPSEAAA